MHYRVVNLLLYFTVIFNFTHASQPTTITLAELYQHGDGFNIEAGTPFFHLNQQQIWLHLAAVLDRPLLDGKTLAEITTHNPYPLKESSIAQYNEAQVNLALALITIYYLQQGHTLLQKPANELMTICLQVHRNSSGLAQVKMLQTLLAAVINFTPLENQQLSATPGFITAWYLPAYHAKLEFRIGYAPETIGYYQHADIIFSFALVGGLNPNYPSGTLLLGQEFIPFDVDQNVVRKCDRYQTRNHLLTEITKVITQPLQQELLQLINSSAALLSPNPAKQALLATPLTSADFKPATIFQISRLFNPTDRQQKIKLMTYSSLPAAAWIR